MRNLKKFLALALAMAMTFSLMLSASAADISKFKDQDKVTDEFVESVAVLAGLDVIQGDGEEDNKNIRPGDTITRAEAAALVYRIVTGDVADKQKDLYRDYGRFTDVNEGDWFAGYVGYCQNAGIIKGPTPTTFNPYGKVTGYEVLAMILRAVGYGKNNEFVGSDWQVNVASLGKTKHVTDSVLSGHFNYTLNQPATREVVAELLFRGMLLPQVNWTQLTGYSEYKSNFMVDPTDADKNDSLAWEVFQLHGRYWDFDKWGHPQFTWKANLNPSEKNRTVATLKVKPTVDAEDFHTTKKECDVADLMDFETSKDYMLWVDGVRVTNTYHVEATDTVTKVGGEGRKVYIYTLEDMEKQFPWHNITNYWTNVDKDGTDVYDGKDIIVMVDTYLAKVVTKTDAVLDPAGHVITKARLVVDLYDGATSTPNRRVITRDKNWDEYSAGNVISLNAKAAIETLDKDERWAFTLPSAALESGSTTVLASTANLKLLSGTPAKQTAVLTNQNMHEVGGEKKTDDLAFRMDKAQNNINTTFTWYYDEYGFLLGVDEGSATYGVITSVYVAYGANQSTDGVAKAIATVLYADGTTGTESIDYFMVHNHSDNGSSVGDRYDNSPNEFMTATDNTLQLWPAYNVADKDPMEEKQGLPYQDTEINSKVCQWQGTIFMAPVTLSNAQAALDTTNNNKYGTLKNNLFKFVKSSNDQTVAIEVAGGSNVDESDDDEYNPVDDIDYTAASGNTGAFAGHWAEKNTAGKLYKSLAYVSIDATDVVTWLDSKTQIIFRNEENGSLTTYTLATLPGDITINADVDDPNLYDEIDWVDADNDGRADVIYLTGKLEGVVTYGLFYSNNLSGSWNGSVGQIDGFLNGERKTLTFNDYDTYNAINGASDYAGHLFGVKIINGVVSDVLQTKRDGAMTEILLPASGAIVDTFGADADATESGKVATGISVDGDGDAADHDFKYGTEDGYIGTNPYTNKTKAVYWCDDNVTPVMYNHSANWTLVGATVVVTDKSVDPDDPTVNTYRLTPNSKVYGLGANVVLAEGATALEYLNHSYFNDVTIVYEENETNNSRSVLEMYIETDPNITPSDPTYPGNLPGPGTTPEGLKADENTTVISGDNSDALKTAIKGGVGSVIAAPGVTGNLGGAIDDAVIADILIFPAGNYGAEQPVLNLIIKNSEGKIVYRESITADADAFNFFYVNYKTSSNAGLTTNGGFAKKGNYTFSITMNTGVGVMPVATDVSFTIE